MRVTTEIFLGQLLLIDGTVFEVTEENKKRVTLDPIVGSMDCELRYNQLDLQGKLLQVGNGLIHGEHFCELEEPESEDFDEVEEEEEVGRMVEVTVSVQPNRIIAQIPCVVCKNVHDFPLTEEQFKQLSNRQGRHIQDILPDLKPAEREMFISGYCPSCWDNLFKEFEDE